MLRLVSAVWVELGALAPIETVAHIVEMAVFPSLEMLAHWEEERRVKGGVFPRERETTFALEADSTDAVGELLTNLPL